MIDFAGLAISIGVRDGCTGVRSETKPVIPFWHKQYTKIEAFHNLP